jgi:LacI family transcriptional regulator
MDDSAQTQLPTGRITIRTVAEDAGVSVAAVSKVLRNAYGVSDALRLKVQGSIDRLGYRPSVAARGMRGQTYTLGVLLVGIDNPFLPRVFAGIRDVAERAGYKILMGVGASNTPMEAQLIEQMIDNRMDGLVLVAAQITGKMLATFAQQIPISIIGHHESSGENFDSVNSDDRLGAQLAVRALVERGHRDIAMVSLAPPRPVDPDVMVQREIGYAEAMAKAGLSDQVRFIRFHNEDPDRVAKQRAWIAGPDLPRALFCWSDLDGIPLLNMARQHGLRVPEDLALVAYDNSPVAGLPLINLASIDQEGQKLGRIAMEALLSRIGGRKVAEHFLVAPHLVARGSF